MKNSIKLTTSGKLVKCFVVLLLCFCNASLLSAWDSKAIKNFSISNHAGFDKKFTIKDNTNEFHNEIGIGSENAGKLEIDKAFTKPEGFTIKSGETKTIQLTSYSNRINVATWEDYFTAVMQSICSIVSVGAGTGLTAKSPGTVDAWKKCFEKNFYPNAFIIDFTGRAGDEKWVITVQHESENKASLSGISYSEKPNAPNFFHHQKNGEDIFEYCEEANDDSTAVKIPIVNNLVYSPVGLFSMHASIDILNLKIVNDDHFSNIEIVPPNGDVSSSVNQIPTSYPKKDILRFIKFDITEDMFINKIPTVMTISGDLLFGGKLYINLTITPVILNEYSYEKMNDLGKPNSKGEYYAFEIEAEYKYDNEAYDFLNDNIYNATAMRGSKIIVGLKEWKEDIEDWKFDNTTIELGIDTVIRLIEVNINI